MFVVVVVFGFVLVVFVVFSSVVGFVVISVFVVAVVVGAVTLLLYFVFFLRGCGCCNIWQCYRCCS